MHDRLTYLREGQDLLTALRGGRLVVPSSAWAAGRMLAAARFHGVTPALLRAYENRDASELTALRTDVIGARATALRVGATASDIAECLEEADVPHVFIKGPIVAQAYPNADRSFNDLDVLVAPARVRQALVGLSELGAEVLQQQVWPRSDGVGELTLGLPNGVAIDLHVDLIHRARVRRDFRYPAEPLLNRAITMDIRERPVRTLAVEDHLIYVALHAMLSGGHRLVWVADLDAMIRGWTPRWDVVIDRARQARLALVVGVMLQRSCDLLGTPVPEDVLRGLTRRGQMWNRLLREMERRNRIAACHGPYRTGQFSFRATRRSSVTSAAALADMVHGEWLPSYLANLQGPRATPAISGVRA